MIDGPALCSVMDHLVQLVTVVLSAASAGGIAWLTKRAGKKDRIDAQRWREHDAQQQELMLRFGPSDE